MYGSRQLSVRPFGHKLRCDIERAPRAGWCVLFLPRHMGFMMNREIVDKYASKVPEVTLTFWIIKILATTLGGRPAATP